MMITDPSYRNKNNNNNEIKRMDLDIRVQIPISFEQAFFGCQLNINYNIEEMDENGIRILKSHYDIETLNIKIPFKSCFGFNSTYKGKGIRRGKEVGDAEVHAVIHPHNKFTVDGNHDVRAREKIPLDIMLKGGRFPVQTMFGVKELKVKPGTLPGQEIALNNIGFCRHIVVCEPLFPTANDLRQEAWKGLDINWNIEKEADLEEQKFMSDFLRSRI